jgi:hypothetical protein
VRNLGRIGIIGMALAGIVLAGCIQPTQERTAEYSTEKAPYGIFAAFAQKHELTMAQTQEFLKKNIGINSESEIVEQLPVPTETFEEDRRKLLGSTADELEAIPRENYSQPTFFNDFETSGKEKWVNAKTTTPASHGIISTPADQYATLTPGSTEIAATLFVRAAWGSTYYQGVKLYATITPEAPIKFSVNPEQFLLEPTFPIIQEKWVEKINIRGEITKPLEAGEYVITVKMSDPDVENVIKWIEDGKPYTNANGLFVDPRGAATLTLHVKE